MTGKRLTELTINELEYMKKSFNWIKRQKIWKNGMVCIEDIENVLQEIELVLSKKYDEVLNV